MINVVGANQNGTLTPEAKSPQSLPQVAAVIPTPIPEVIQSNSPIDPNPTHSQRTPLLIAAIVLVLLLAGAVITSYLLKTRQDLRQQAAGETVPTCVTIADCPAGTTRCEAGVCVSRPAAPAAQTEATADVQPSATPPAATGTPGPSATPVPSVSATPIPTPTTGSSVNTTANCNESCTTDTNCANRSHNCYNGTCRLKTNPSDTTCRLPSGGTQVTLSSLETQRTYTPDSTPSGTTPVTGPADWGKWFIGGVGTLGAGALLVLFWL